MMGHALRRCNLNLKSNERNGEKNAVFGYFFLSLLAAGAFAVETVG